MCKVEWRGRRAQRGFSVAESSPAANRFEDLWQTYRPRVRARLRSQRLLDQSVDAEDLEQEVYLRLWQALSHERNIDKPASYVFRIVNTAIIDAARRAQAREASRRDAKPLAEIEGRSSASPEPATERSQVTDAVTKQLDNMAPDRAVAIKLHLQGFTTTEIGQMRGWTEARARNLVYRGLGEVRGELGELSDPEILER